MNKGLKRELTAIVGEDRATDEPLDLAACSFAGEQRPELALYPISTDEVSRILKVAHREEIPVTARGSADNSGRGTVAIPGGLVLVFSSMNKILEIDADNRTAILQPGVMNYDFRMEVEKSGLMYPPDPDSWETATMGGTVGANAGGLRTLKYGVTTDYLLGLTLVLANGDILKTGGRAIKNVTGYDLTRLMCGSQGTLGLVTEIIVRLIPKPKAVCAIRADFRAPGDSADAVAEMIAQGVIPAGLELMDKAVLRAVEAETHVGLATDVGAMLLIEVDGDPATLEIQVKKIEKILQEKNAAGIVRVDKPEDTDKLLNAGRSAFRAIDGIRPKPIIEDLTVAVSNLPAMVRELERISEEHKIQIGVLAFGGRGALRPVIFLEERDKDEQARIEAVIEDIYRAATEPGGAGPPPDTALFRGKADDVALTLTRRIKQGLDPKGILNPGRFV